MAPTKLSVQYTMTKTEHASLASTNGAMMTSTNELKFSDGGMDGVATASLVMTKFPTKCEYKFDGHQLFTGTVAGKKGTVAFRLDGTMLNGDAKATWTILPESATDELVGIKGTGTYGFHCGPDTDPLKLVVHGDLTVDWA